MYRFFSKKQAPILKKAENFSGMDGLLIKRPRADRARRCKGADSRARRNAADLNRPPLKWYAPIASVAAVSDRHGGLQHALRLLLWRKPPRFVIARRPQADVAISRHMAGSQENHRRNRSCLPEIAPQGHFLALRAQGATAPSGPRNDNSGKCRGASAPFYR